MEKNNSNSKWVDDIIGHFVHSTHFNSTSDIVYVVGLSDFQALSDDISKMFVVYDVHGLKRERFFLVKNEVSLSTQEEYVEAVERRKNDKLKALKSDYERRKCTAERKANADKKRINRLIENGFE